jgi:hypothetical protein
MRRYVSYALPLLVAVAPLHAESGSALLKQLAAELKSMRSLPVGTPTHATCPKDSSALIGLRQQQSTCLLPLRSLKWRLTIAGAVREAQ